MEARLIKALICLNISIGFYNEATVDIKQKAGVFDFRWKLIFENDRVQTPKMNEIVSLIMLEHKELETMKKESKKNFSSILKLWTCRDSNPESSDP